MKIDILMATYNGEKYLRNQLLSLQQQTHENWILWVRDDGSSDSTLQIINDFSKLDPRIRNVSENSGINLKPGKNFLGLTKYASSKYTIFCDQDDLWFEKKLELLCKFAEKNFDEARPCLVYCDAYGYSDIDGVISLDSVSKHHAKSLRQFLFFNSGYQGSSLLFNRNLCKLAAEYRANYFYMHDDVVSLLAHTFGQVFFLPKKLMLYRQHASNVTGNISKGLYHKIKRLLNNNTYVIDRRHFNEKISFFEAYQHELSGENKKIFTNFFLYPTKNIFGRLFIVLINNYSLGQYKFLLIIKTLLLKPLG